MQLTKVLILGAHGQIAQLAEQQLLTDTDAILTLFLRNAQRLASRKSERVRLIEGTATDKARLQQAMQGQDLVYANLAGKDIEKQAEAVAAAMQAVGLKRLIWISSLGIYDEVPGKFGEWNKNILGDYLDTYGNAVRVLEQSALDYTIIRPAWLTDKNEVDYETTQKGEPFKGTEVSRKSVADFVVKLIEHPRQEIRHSVGIDKPGTAGDKPAWY